MLIFQTLSIKLIALSFQDLLQLFCDANINDCIPRCKINEGINP